MSRKENFKKAADDYVEGEPDGAQKIVGQVGFEFGAEYGYQYAVDKMAEYLLSSLESELGYFATGDFVKGVMKFMEGL